MNKKYLIPESDVQQHLVNEFQVIYEVRQKEFGFNNIAQLRALTNLPDEYLSEILGISVKTFRAYKQENSIQFKDNFKELVLVLTKLFNHGIEILGNKENFDNWLITPNFYFDKEAPVRFLSTYSGIKFTESRLVAMAYGDNV
ncbi:MAG: antitoxin Xre/MbcA/ParS toxin-binding domain-containing protein [Luteibaculaceae bacterium]